MDPGLLAMDQPLVAKTAIAREMVSFRAIYERWFHETCRWLRAMGCADSELEDLAQEVFLVVRRRLGGFEGASPKGWIYRIAYNVARAHRRRLWFRRVIFLGDSGQLEAIPERAAGPAETLEQREAAHRVEAVLSKMSAKRRRAFYLFEVEGYSSDEIAQLEGIPDATARTRLFHARKEFRQQLKKMEAKR